jgi:hypothetical protein
MLDADTDPGAHRFQVACLRRMGPEARLALALELSDEVRAISEAARGGFAPGPEGRRERVRLWYGIDLPPRGRSPR